MAQGEFKHITVTPADEDDIVINAGISKSSVTTDSDFGDEQDSAEITANSSESSETRLHESSAKSAKTDVAVVADRKSQVQRTATKDDYHEATLEDLQGEPMSFTQKVVIIAAVVCIIGALVYYFAVLR